jgi:hypothetical protein
VLLAPWALDRGRICLCSQRGSDSGDPGSVKECQLCITVRKQSFVYGPVIAGGAQGSNFSEERSVTVPVPSDSIGSIGLTQAPDGSSHSRVEYGKSASADEVQQGCRARQPEALLDTARGVCPFSPVLQELASLPVGRSLRQFRSRLHPDCVSDRGNIGLPSATPGGVFPSTEVLKVAFREGFEVGYQVVVLFFRKPGRKQSSPHSQPFLRREIGTSGTPKVKTAHRRYLELASGRESGHVLVITSMVLGSVFGDWRQCKTSTASWGLP